MTATLTLRAMDSADWPEVRSIYQDGIETGQATFEFEAPDWEYFNRSRLPQHRHVAADAGGAVVGWAAVQPVSTRAAYAGVVEHSVYVSSATRGLGIGKALLGELIRSTESDGIWTIQASIFPENEASLRLHLTHGFAVVGRRERIARMTHGPLSGQWRDTLLIERRSPAV